MKRHLALEAVISPEVVGLGYEFVGLEYLPAGKNSILRIYIDKPGGVSIDACEQVSRQVASVLDVEAELVRGAYTLEVSSPGLDRKLFTPEQFPKFVSKKLKLSLRNPLNGQRNFIGILSTVSSEQLSLDVDETAISIDFANIAQANVIDEKAR